MAKQRETNIDEVIESLSHIFKQITRKNASKKPEVIQEREQHLIEKYNELVDIGKVVYTETDQDEIKYVRANTVEARDKTIHCLGILHSKAKVPTDLTQKIEDNFYTTDSEHSSNQSIDDNASAHSTKNDTPTHTPTKRTGTIPKHKKNTDDKSTIQP